MDDGVDWAEYTTIDTVLNMLTTQTFADWYNKGTFDKWMCDAIIVPIEQVKKELIKLLGHK